MNKIKKMSALLDENKKLTLSILDLDSAMYDALYKSIKNHNDVIQACIKKLLRKNR